MKIAIIGSRGLLVHDFTPYLPPDVTEIISGGARGIDTCAREYALAHGIKLTEIRPDYARYKRGAPFKRNCLIVDMADAVIAFWDGESSGTAFVIDYCRKQKKNVTIHHIEP